MKKFSKEYIQSTLTKLLICLCVWIIISYVIWLFDFIFSEWRSKNIFTWLFMRSSIIALWTIFLYFIWWLVLSVFIIILSLYWSSKNSDETLETMDLWDAKWIIACIIVWWIIIWWFSIKNNIDGELTNKETVVNMPSKEYYYWLCPKPDSSWLSEEELRWWNNWADWLWCSSSSYDFEYWCDEHNDQLEKYESCIECIDSSYKESDLEECISNL